MTKIGAHLLKQHTEYGWTITAGRSLGTNLGTSLLPSTLCRCAFLLRNVRVMLKVSVPGAALSPWTVSESPTGVLTDTQIFNNCICVWKYLLPSRYNTEQKYRTRYSIETKDSTLFLHFWIIKYDPLLLFHLAHPDVKVVHYSLITGKLSKAVWVLFSQRDGCAVWHTDVALSETFGLAHSRLSGFRVLLTDCCPCFSYISFCSLTLEINGGMLVGSQLAQI